MKKIGIVGGGGRGVEGEGERVRRGMRGIS
jgi:hypothetical protein